MSGVIATKLLAPTATAGSNVIDRPRLLSLVVNSGPSQFVLIHAPAGYGKTVFMLQTVTALRKPYLWYQLDAYDNDPATVIQHLLTGLQRHQLTYGNTFLKQIAQTGSFPNPRLVVGAIVNALANQAQDGFILALDDYHFIREPAVDRFFQELAHYLPETTHLIIASRSAVPWLAERIDATLVRAEDLRFTRQETKTLFTQGQVDLSEETLDALERNTAGWPIVIRLSKDSSGKGFTNLFEMQKERIERYLVREVLDQQRAEVRRFLLDTAVLDTLTPSRCDLLLERKDSATILNYLAEQQLFIMPLSGQERSYRYYQLIKELLLEQLGEKRNALLLKAGQITRESGDWGQAVEYYRSAGAFTEMAGMVKKAGFTVLQQGQWLTVQKWLEAIPAPQQENDPWLALLRAVVEFSRGRLDTAELYVEKATAGFERSRNPVGKLESQILKARIAGRRGLSQTCFDQLHAISARLPAPEIQKRFYMPLEQSACLIKLGRLREAEQLLVAALATAQEENNHFVLACLAENLGSVYCLLGEYPKAIQKFQWALQIAPEQNNLRNYYFQDTISGIYVDWGEPDRAFEIAQKNALSKEKYGLVETLPANYLYMGVACLAKGRYLEAENHLRRGIEIIEVNEGDLYFLVLSRNFLSWCLYAQNRWSESLSLLEESLRQAGLHGGLLPPITYMMKATVLALTGETQEAVSLLDQAVPALETMGAQIPLCMAYKALAASHFAQGRIADAATFARNYLELASKVNLLEGYLSVTHDLVNPILRYGLVNGIQIVYCQRILARLRDRAVGLLSELAGHPDADVRKRVIIPLAEVGSPAAAAILKSLCNDTDPEVREAATRFTGGGKYGAPAISCAGRDPSPILQARTFGPFQIFWEDKEIANWPTAKSCHLLAYLIHRGEPVNTERLFEDLWPGYDYEKVAANFHMSMYRLRRALRAVSNRDDLILYRNKHYQLQAGCYRTDKNEFEERVKIGLTRLQREGGLQSPDAATELEQALALYRGDYLTELDYPWVIWEQEHLKQLFIAAKMHLARYYIQANASNRAITHLNSILETNPLIEEAHCLLMEAWAGLGDCARVHEVYRDLVKTLQRELGIAPALKTRELFGKLIKR